MAEWVFAISAIVVLYTWVGYPALLALWAALRGDLYVHPFMTRSLVEEMEAMS